MPIKNECKNMAKPLVVSVNYPSKYLNVRDDNNIYKVVYYTNDDANYPDSSNDFVLTTITSSQILIELFSRTVVLFVSTV